MIALILYGLGAWVGAALLFALGWACRARLHRCEAPTVGAVNDAYQRGRADGRREREATGLEDLERMYRMEALPPREGRTS